MALEIERKYLVNDDSYKSMAKESVLIRQGYLSHAPERTVRVRIKGDHGYITVKGITRDAVREEFEYEIPIHDAEAMLNLCEGRILEKRRWYVYFEGKLWEIDEFMGDLSPLVVAEIELDNPEESFSIPTFIREEVTGNPAYYNSSL